MKEQPTNPAPRARRQDRLIHERVHDPYQSKRKLPEPTVCPHCGAVFHQGRWTWTERPTHPHEALCPACQRLRNEDPAGYVTLSGRFLQEHHEEIVNLARNEERDEKAEHPLHRIMHIAPQDDGFLITTTDLHLPRRIGEALYHAYQGELDFHYVEEGSILRVSWKRNDESEPPRR